MPGDNRKTIGKSTGAIRSAPAKQETPDIGGTPPDNTPANPDNYTDATAVPTETPVPAAP